MKSSYVLIAALALFSLPALADSKLTDPQIAHIAFTAGQIDIKAAELALQKTQNPAVREFATQMQRDHTDVNNQAQTLLGELNVQPQDNPVSQSLTKGADASNAALEKLSGASFDRAYIEHEIAYHKAVNSTLETTLIPESKNAKLKDFLKTGLKIFRGHEKHAEDTLKELKSMKS